MSAPTYSGNDRIAADKAEFAALDVWKQSIQFKLARHEKLKEKLKLCYEDDSEFPPAQPITESLGSYELQVTARSIEKKWVSMLKVYKAVGGLKKFLSICDITHKALSGMIGEPEASALQVESVTGSRRIKAVLKVEPPALEKAA